MTSCDDVGRLVLRGIRKAYLSVLASDGIVLAVWTGGIQAMLGENGVGAAPPQCNRAHHASQA